MSLNERYFDARVLYDKSSYVDTNVGDVVFNALEKSGKNPILLDNVHLLLQVADKPEVKALIEQRKGAPRADMMQEANRFSDAEIGAIVEEMHSIQLNTECTVGCSWCGAMSIRKRRDEEMGGAVSLDSFDAFTKKFKNYFPRQTNSFQLAYASDPFDWMDNQGHTYVDMAKAFRSNTRLHPYTSTAVPIGSEFAVIEYLIYLNEMYKILEDKKILKKTFRFSRTKQNSERVNQILAVIRGIGINEDFIDFVIDEAKRDLDGYEDIRRSGYFLKYKNQNKIHKLDKSGIFCEDGVYYSSHKGFVGATLECVTAHSPTGTHETIMIPGKQEIPTYLSIARHYTNRLPIGKDCHLKVNVIPEVKYKVVVAGIYSGDIKVSSVRREAFAFSNLLYDLDVISYTIRHPDVITYFQENPESATIIYNDLLKFKQNVWPQVQKRVNNCLKLCESESDQEAVNLTKGYIEQLEEWFATMDSLGLDQYIKMHTI